MALMPHEIRIINIILAFHTLRMHVNAMQRHQSEQPQISRHAIERYQQRVSFVPHVEAAQRLAELAANSARRPTPRRWTNVPECPAMLFLYPRANSAVCLLMKCDTVITVFSRDACRAWRSSEEMIGARPFLRQPPYPRPSPGSFPLEAA
jgi:hypothetical protein